MGTTEAYSVHDEPDFARTYDEDDMIEVRRGDLRALLDLATGSMDFGSGFWDNEQTEIARKIAVVLGIDPMIVTPSPFTAQYLGDHVHTWIVPSWARSRDVLFCEACRHTAKGTLAAGGALLTD